MLFPSWVIQGKFLNLSIFSFLSFKMVIEYIPTAPSPARQDQGILVQRRMLSHPVGRVLQATSLTTYK